MHRGTKLLYFLKRQCELSQSSFMLLRQLVGWYTLFILKLIGLPRLSALLFDQKETISHLLTSCAFCRLVWFAVLSQFGVQRQQECGQRSTALGCWWLILLTLVNLEFHILLRFSMARGQLEPVVDGIIPEVELWKAAGAKALWSLPLHARPRDTGSASETLFLVA
jgi:hypothetical protein